jgi:alkyl hydroperoxide reductase subunit AhpF
LELKVFTLKTCPNCPQVKKIAKEVAEELNLKITEIDIETPEGQIEGLMYQIMSTPSIAIDSDVVARGKPISKKELMDEIRKRLGNDKTLDLNRKNKQV